MNSSRMWSLFHGSRFSLILRHHYPPNYTALCHFTETPITCPVPTVTLLFLNYAKMSKLEILSPICECSAKCLQSSQMNSNNNLQLHCKIYKTKKFQRKYRVTQSCPQNSGSKTRWVSKPAPLCTLPATQACLVYRFACCLHEENDLRIRKHTQDRTEELCKLQR